MTSMYPDADVSESTRDRARDIYEKTNLGELQAMVVAIRIDHPEITHREIGERLDRSTSTINTVVSKARQKYKQSEMLVMLVDPGVFESRSQAQSRVAESDL